MKRRAILYLARLAAQKLLGFLLYLAGTGFILYPSGCVYFALLFITTMTCGVILLRTNAETLAERGKVVTDSPGWDKALLTLFWLINYFIIYLVAGLYADASHGMGVRYWLGIALAFAAGYITLRATLQNTFLESTARIQSDRDQTVCSTGPYAVVRHPAYASVLINCVSLCLVFPGMGVYALSAAIAVIIIVRTALEDRLLMANLAGYADYAERVRYRLIPYIW